MIESNIRIIEIAAHYGNYNVSLFFDLKDIANGDEYLQEDIRVKSMLFNEKCCVFPKTIFVDEMNDELEKVTRDKGWQTEEMDFGWLLQKNSQGDKRILDRNRRLRMQSGEKIKPEVVNDYWKDIKYQLENNYDFWNNWLKKVPPVTIEIWSKQLSEK